MIIIEINTYWKKQGYNSANTEGFIVKEMPFNKSFFNIKYNIKLENMTNWQYLPNYSGSKRTNPELGEIISCLALNKFYRKDLHVGYGVTNCILHRKSRPGFRDGYYSLSYASFKFDDQIDLIYNNDLFPTRNSKINILVPLRFL